MAINAGAAKVWGYELGIDYSHSFSKNNILGFKAGYSFNKSEWLVINNDEIISGNTTHRKGYSISEYYGYVTDGLLTQEDLDQHIPVIGGYDATGTPSTQRVGDIHFIDTDGDGIITNNDRVPLGSADPNGFYYANVNGKIGNFDFELMLNGVGNCSVIYPASMRQMMDVSNGNTPLTVFRDHWSVDNLDAKYPRLSTVPGNNALVSDYWRGNGAYCRVKYIQLGYTSPWIANKLHVQKAHFYFNIQNPLTFSNLVAIDPETRGELYTHPLFRTYSMGINLNF